jgi:hypothetical protein
MFQIDPIAVGVASLVSFAFGALWYSPVVLLSVWAREAGVDPSTRPENPALVFGGAFVLTVVSALALTIFVGPVPTVGAAAGTGAVLGACIAASSIGVNYLFAQRSLLMLLIDGSFHTVRFALMGVVLGLWSG